MNKKYLILAAVAAVGLFLVQKSAKAGAARTTMGAQPFNAPAALLSTLANTQIELANGAVLDTGNGVIFDPITGNYTDTFAGALIYSGA